METFKVTGEMLAPIATTLSENALTIVPWGIGIIALFAGINLVPKMIKKFAKG